MSGASNIPKGVRLSQHLDYEAQVEVFQLKHKLQEMTDVVQQLLQQMNILEKTPGLLFYKGSPQDCIQKDSVATQTSPMEEIPWVSSPALRDKMKELVNMNLSWQKYNALQEQHTQTLTEKVKELESKLKASQESTTQLQTTKEQLRSENLRLQAELEKLKLIMSRESAKSENAGREALLEAQAMIYKEDFETERKDREKAQARVSQLEIQLQELQRKMEHLKKYPSAGEGSHNQEREDRNLLRKNNKPAYDEVDGVLTDGWSFLEPNRKSHALPGKTQNDTVNDNVLRCTKCFRAFTRNEHLELLDHYDQCCNQ